VGPRRFKHFGEEKNILPSGEDPGRGRTGRVPAQIIGLSVIMKAIVF